MPRTVEKVTAFITCQSGDGYDLLLFEHPNAGIQIPAGTVEDQETPEEAVMREATEETGLASLSIRRYLGCIEEKLPDKQWIIAEPTKVYARPDLTSFDWAFLRKGILVIVNRKAGGFSQVTYKEFDQVPDPQYVSMCITGWVLDEMLVDTVRRHFFHLEYPDHPEPRWTVFTDNQLCVLFWAPLTGLPKIIHPQDAWLELLPRLNPGAAR